MSTTARHDRPPHDSVDGRRAPAPERYTLLPPAPVSSTPPVLDAHQQAVVDHRDGPLLVLAGPGTGKTTTLVEACAARLQGSTGEDGTGTPAGVLVLTFSRRAAADLRRRIAARLGRSTVTPTAMTFHSFCLAVVRRFADPELFGSGLRLLTAPEQEFRVRETLAGTERVEWPTSFDRAVGTRAFAAEVRAVIARARQLGMDPEDVVEAGERAGRADWTAVGEFFEEYLTVLDAEEVIDYTELVHRCRLLLLDPYVRDTLRREHGSVLVDEYQDTDPAQVEVLRALAGDGRDLVVVGDPDQSIYAFRGADSSVLSAFPTTFRTRTGEPAPVLALAATRRFGRRIAHATRLVARRLPAPPGLGAEQVQAFRDPEVVDTGHGSGRVEVLSCDSTGAEAEHIADVLRTAHLRDGLDWSEMAVLVRSGRISIPPLSRALTAAGVPVEVAGDEIPLGAELAVRPLLLALQVVTRGRRLDADEAARLVVSPLGGLDGLGLRRLGRALRDAERRELAGAALPRSSAELVRRALVDPALLEECEPSVEVDRAGRLAALLQRVEQVVARGATAEEALWELWTGTGWPQRLRAGAGAGGDVGVRSDRDLDAVCALFELAARSQEVIGTRGLEGFIAEVEGQQIPADTQREADVRGSAVRLLTAHRSKGLEWPLVVVASVQEGLWPDLRRRGSLLEADRLGRDGLSEPEPTRVRLAEERRLFYVACTRARQRLVVTSVAGTEGEGDQPSRFLTELGVDVQQLTGRPRRPLTLPALVGELRRVSVDPETPPALREAACVRLARLADARDEDGRPVAPAADPARWWGMDDLTRADRPVVAPGAPVRITGSSLEALLACPRRWFLGRRAQAESGRSSAASVGSVVHVLVEHAARGSITAVDVREHLDRVWEQISFDANWMEAGERLEAELALERYFGWQQRSSTRTLLGTEVPFEVTVEAAGEPVVLTGSVDRLERTPDGRLQIVDFKTSRRLPRPEEVLGMDQLGVYQLAAQHGAFEAVAGTRAVAGAELVFLRQQDGDGVPYPRVLSQPSLDEVPHLPEADDEQRSVPTWVHERLARAVAVVRGEQFDARAGDACRYCAFTASCPAVGRGAQVVR
ncbi:ATP-dependent helicase [Auraticoccus monumenti]|uniref:ATP-dependent helicase n=1 Tax=Auraticoccus monumenti TaxID=675864 RepID=UPI001E4B4E60|nr:ATP-dependent DNA helicase [Auraticoccus monumenti]